MKTQIELLPNQPKILTKEQYAFNKKLEDIKTLQSEYKRISDALPQATKQYEDVIKHFEPIILELTILRIIAIDEYSHRVKFTKKQADLLGNYLIDEIENVFDKSDEKDERLLEIFSRYTKMSFDEYEAEVAKQEREASANVLKNMFGVDVEIDDEKSIEEIYQEAHDKIQEKMENDKKLHEERFQNRKKTKAETKREEQQKASDDLKKRSIREIYIEMIKIFHPDTEQDEDKKLEKEEISKRLTEAYQKNDVFTLLKIETDYLQLDSERIARLSNDKLKIYSEILTSQKMKLEHELGVLKQENKIVYQGMLNKNSKAKSFLNKLKREMEEESQEIRNQTSELKSFDPKIKEYLLIYIEDQLLQSQIARNSFLSGFAF